MQALTIPASACQIEVATSARPTLTAGFWHLGINGKATFLCPVPIAGKADLAINSFRLIYSDPDGLGGNASVKAFVVVTRLVSPFGPIETSYASCEFLSNFQGRATTTWTLADVVCAAPVAIPLGSHAEILVELWRRGAADRGFYAGLGGIDFP